MRVINRDQNQESFSVITQAVNSFFFYNLLRKNHSTKKVEIDLIPKGKLVEKNLNKSLNHFENEPRSRSEAPSQAAFTQIL